MLLTEEDLWGPVPQSHNLVCVCANRQAHSSSQAEISQLKTTLRVNQEVLGLQVTVQDATRMAVSHPTYQLIKVTLHGEFIEKPKRTNSYLDLDGSQASLLLPHPVHVSLQVQVKKFKDKV